MDRSTVIIRAFLPWFIIIDFFMVVCFLKMNLNKKGRVSCPVRFLHRGIHVIEFYGSESELVGIHVCFIMNPCFTVSSRNVLLMFLFSQIISLYDCVHTVSTIFVDYVMVYHFLFVLFINKYCIYCKMLYICLSHL